MTTEENPSAGQGPVVLDIGDDVGALVVTMPAWMDGLEVEIIPSGSRQAGHEDHPRGDHHEHEHGHGLDGHTHPASAPPHVAVVARPLPDGSTVHSLVYGELTDGDYDLYVRPNGPVQLTATVCGGQVTLADWPEAVAV